MYKILPYYDYMDYIIAYTLYERQCRLIGFRIIQPIKLSNNIFA